jgi:hypothetical protein
MSWLKDKLNRSRAPEPEAPPDPASDIDLAEFLAPYTAPESATSTPGSESPCATVEESVR